MRVKTAEANSYHYPDISVACGTPQFEDAHVDTLLNPTLLIEVLSPSTEAYDRGGKFAHYRKISTLREYLLVAQDQLSVERYIRHITAAHRHTSYRLLLKLCLANHKTSLIGYSPVDMF